MDLKITDAQPPSGLRAAITDIVDGTRAYSVWSALGWQDIRQRYRRSMLGPFWITLTMLVTIVGMGPLYGALLKLSNKDFIPYLSLGIISWGLISMLLMEGGSSFHSAESMIRSVRLPLTLHILRGIYRNFIIFLHNLVAYIPVMLFVGIMPKVTWLLAIPGAMLLLIAAFPMSIILGIFCTRFRDMQPIVSSIVQLAFFLTPIIWKPEALGKHAYLVQFNPLYTFLELIRGPIYGDPPDWSLYLNAIGITALLYVIAVPLFARFRSRVAFWI